jgi:hypothetical protein
MAPNNRGQAMAHIPDHVLEELQDLDAENQRLRKADFDLTDATANQRSKVAEYQPDLPLALREDADMRIAFVAGEEFTTDGTGGNTETFNLSNDIVDSPNATDLVLYDSGSRVQPDSVDHATDSFDYTNPDASQDTLHAFYVARNPGTVEIEVVSPKAQGNVSKTVYDDVTSIIAERNQNKEPLEFDFDDALEGLIPARWNLQVYVDAPFAVRWDDGGLATSNGDEAVNAIVSMPVRRAHNNVEGLGQAVKQDIIAPSRNQ